VADITIDDPLGRKIVLHSKEDEGNARMVALDTIEGIINNVVWFHYSVIDDVLYLRLQSARDSEALGEETDDGFILLRDAVSDKTVGLTVVKWWKRFGHGDLPDSLAAIEKQIEPWMGKLAA
jgi:hypothetical protein